jgi:hypothetical protein
MWPHFVHLVWRTIHGMPLVVSSNWASWALGLVVFVLYEFLAIIFRGWQDVVSRWKQNVGIGLLATAGGYVLLFAYSAVITTYDEHHDSTGRWKAVVNEKDSLKTQLKQRDDYVARLEAKSCPICPHRTSAPQSVAAEPVETIHSLELEVRVTCDLKNPSHMPEDLWIMLPSRDTFLIGPAGRVVLHTNSARYQRTEEGKVNAIEIFTPLPNSDLIGLPVPELANYTQIDVAQSSTSGGKFSGCSFAETTLRINGRDIFRHGQPLNVILATDKQGVIFSVILTGQMNLPK